MVLYVDTREQGRLPDMLLEPNAVEGGAQSTYLEYGDYIITGGPAGRPGRPDTGPLEAPAAAVIERKTYDDFVGSIKSGRLDVQLRGCQARAARGGGITCLLLQGSGSIRSDMKPAAYVSKMAALAWRGITVVSMRDEKETFYFVKKLAALAAAGTEAPAASAEPAISEWGDSIRVRGRKTETDSAIQQAIWMLQGLPGVGPHKARKMLEGRSISDIISDTGDKKTEVVRRACAASLPAGHVDYQIPNKK